MKGFDLFFMQRPLGNRISGQAIDRQRLARMTFLRWFQFTYFCIVGVRSVFVDRILPFLLILHQNSILLR